MVLMPQRRIEASRIDNYAVIHQSMMATIFQIVSNPSPSINHHDEKVQKKHSRTSYGFGSPITRFFEGKKDFDRLVTNLAHRPKAPFAEALIVR
jgi:hypothetical protein